MGHASTTGRFATATLWHKQHIQHVHDAHRCVCCPGAIGRLQGQSSSWQSPATGNGHELTWPPCYWGGATGIHNQVLYYTQAALLSTVACSTCMNTHAVFPAIRHDSATACGRLACRASGKLCQAGYYQGTEQTVCTGLACTGSKPPAQQGSSK